MSVCECEYKHSLHKFINLYSVLSCCTIVLIFTLFLVRLVFFFAIGFLIWRVKIFNTNNVVVSGFVFERRDRPSRLPLRPWEAATVVWSEALRPLANEKRHWSWRHTTTGLQTLIKLVSGQCQVNDIWYSWSLKESARLDIVSRNNELVDNCRWSECPWQ